MGAFMDRYNRMKGIGTVPDTVQAEGGGFLLCSCIGGEAGRVHGAIQQAS